MPAETMPDWSEADPFSFGDGPDSVLLIHGFTSTPRDLRELGRRLAERRGVLCRGMRLPGHGTRLEDLQDVSWRDHLQAALAEFDALPAGRRFVAGFSFGGTLALHIALRRQVEGVILLAPFLGLPPWNLLTREWLVLAAPLLGIDRVERDEHRGFFDAEARSMHLCYPWLPMRGVREVVLCARALRRRIREVRCPTLILQGDADDTAVSSGAIGLAHVLGSRAELRILHSRHILPLDQARERVAEEAEAWMARRRATA